jgi:hypothetical protein
MTRDRTPPASLAIISHQAESLRKLRSKTYGRFYFCDPLVKQWAQDREAMASELGQLIGKSTALWSSDTSPAWGCVRRQSGPHPTGSAHRTRPRALTNGEMGWRYQSYQGDLLCLEYILRFDPAGILRQWTRQVGRGRTTGPPAHPR